MRRSQKATWVAVGTLILMAVLGWMADQQERGSDTDQGEIEDLFMDQRSGVMVESVGVVTKVLPDDQQGSRHQRFILRLSPGHTVLISHNIDIAPRVAGISRGDTVAFRGQYEWNAKGGVIHWTHHDPGGDRPGGWIRQDGREYR